MIYPRLSIIIPVYNVEQFLNQCIESVVGQTLSDIEIILIDDGSTDKSGVICDKWKQKDPRICVIHQVNRGRISARKEGLRIATASYVGFVDADDWIEADMYQTLLDLMFKHEVDLVDCGYKRYVSETNQAIHTDCVPEKKYEIDEMPYIKRCFSGCVEDCRMIQSHCTRVYRTELIREAMVQICNDIELGEDGVCIYWYLRKCKSIYVSHLPLYYYRIHGGSSVQRQNEQYLGQVNCYYTEYLKAIQGDECEQEVRKALEKKLIDLTLSGLSKMLSVQSVRCRKYCICAKALKNKRVIIYGAGSVGQDIFSQLLDDSSVEIVGWVDQNWNRIGTVFGWNIQDVGWIINKEYDAILIATVKLENAQQMSSLLRGMGIDHSKIIWIKPREMYDMNSNYVCSE